MKKFVPDSRAPLVRRFFQIAAKTRSLAEAFRFAKANGLWTAKQSVQHALGNRVYVGAHRTPDGWIEKHHEALVDEGTFVGAQATIGLTYYPRHRKVDRVFILQGLVRCKHCGKMMTPKHTKKGDVRFFYYSCQTTCVTCPVKNMPALDFEEWAWERLAALCQNPQVLQSALDEYERGYRTRNADAFARVDACESKLKHLNLRLETLKAYMNSFINQGRLPPHSVGDDLLAVENEIKQATADLMDAKERARPPQKLDAERFIRALRDILASGNADPKRKSAVMHALVKEVVVSESRIEMVLLDPAAQDADVVREATGGQAVFAEPSNLAEREGFEPPDTIHARIF
jgi:site-specific DNA recombinase